ncbi:hypothetical protein HGRIS_001826 [Hohenbuehelia grisea]|uniref:Uncharacterized protein n=1 Tax=Hohenbuehelia grisea TaxID=104357 RepID=A0ABR3JJD8_9AGAR
MKRIGYDADTQQYIFSDSGGTTWRGAEGSMYGIMKPAAGLVTQSRAAAPSERAAVSHEEKPKTTPPTRSATNSHAEQPKPKATSHARSSTVSHAEKPKDWLSTVGFVEKQKSLRTPRTSESTTQHRDHADKPLLSRPAKEEVNVSPTSMLPTKSSSFAAPDNRGFWGRVNQAFRRSAQENNADEGGEGRSSSPQAAAEGSTKDESPSWMDGCEEALMFADREGLIYEKN